MEGQTEPKLRIGEWTLNAATGEMSRNGVTQRLDLRATRLLVSLAKRAGRPVNLDELLSEVWPEVTVSPDSVYQAVASLRRLLGDNPKNPAYIETLPRLGYRMIARVEPDAPPPAPGALGGRPKPEGSAIERAPIRRGTRLWPFFAAGAIVCIVAAVGIYLLHKTQERRAADEDQAQRSVAVLPFLDLTEGMKDEEFADGITEELIDKLSRVQGLRVSSPTASFYYKSKLTPVDQIGRTLGVAYVLDGSLRKDGNWVRVDVRLVRAQTAYVVWSETYDQPMTSILAIQDDIAGKAAKSLKSKFSSGGDRAAPK